MEFTHGTAMESLEPLLPLKLQNPTQTDTVYEVKSLASVYTLEQMLKEELAHLA